MAITIEKDGWKVSADTSEELEIGIAVVQRALTASFTSDKRSPGRPRGQTGSGWTVKRKKFDKQKKATIKHLKAVNSAPDGLSQEELMAALNLKHTRRIGAQNSSTNALLRKLEFEPSSVYFGAQRSGEATRWQPGKKIEEAIRAIEEYEGDV